MSYNQYHFKARVAPKDYLNGDVRVFTSDEIRQWESSEYAVQCRNKIKDQAGMNETEIRFLDTLSQVQAETTYAEVMEGVASEGNYE